MPREITDFKTLSDEPDLQTYRFKPIENFGANMLKDMGFTVERGIGRSNSNALAQPIVLKIRPKGLGLGATEDGAEKVPQFAIGDEVLVSQEPHDGMTGTIRSLNGDDAQIELRVSQAIIKAKIKNITKLTATDLQRLQKSQAKESKKARTLKWVYPNIRVKVVDKASKFYLKKLIVTEVLNAKQFQCYDEVSKEYLRGLVQRDIQTVVPQIGGRVVILRGKNIGEKGTVMERGKKLVVKTENEFELLKLSEDDASEYVEL